MKRIRSIILLLLSGFSLFTNCSKNEQADSKVNIYLVAFAGTSLEGKQIGCGDVLVSVTKNVLVEKNVVESAINELLLVTDTDELRNFVKGPGLLLFQATIANETADVYLKGEFNISGVCDIPRIKEQLYETIKQFPEIKKVNIFINDKSLEDYLSLAGKGF
jgi:spore germination protein GerM